jgi:hypothetical protein
LTLATATARHMVDDDPHRWKWYHRPPSHHAIVHAMTASAA